MELTSLNPGAAVAVIVARFAGGFRTIAGRLRQAIRRHREIVTIESELTGMRDRELADLGIRRCDIPRIAREAVEQR